MHAKFMCKANISVSVTSFWVPACLVALLVLGTLTTIAAADCNPVGTWHGQWNSYDGASGPIDSTFDCGGHAVGTMVWDLRPDVDCVLYFDIDTTFTLGPEECHISYCFEDTEYCLGIPVTVNICIEGDSTGCDVASGTYSGWSRVNSETFDEWGTWAVNRTSPPEKAFNPSPPDSVAIKQSISADLNWYNCGACNFDVYFGTDSTPNSGEFKGNQPGTAYIPGPLSYDTTYYWRIDAKNTNGTATGNVWYFMTEPAPIQHQLTTDVVGDNGVIEPNDGLYDAETVLLSENFNDGDYDGWTIVDEGDQDAPSDWSAVTGTMVQSSNIYSLPVGAGLGTYALYDSGYNWTNYRFSLTIRSDDDDSIGVMFRYQDENNYYRFSWDKQRALRRLVKCENGDFVLLAQDNVPYISGRDYLLEIVADGSILEVYIDNTLIFSVTDTSFASGSIALYSWGNEGSYFDNIEVAEQTIVTLIAVPDAGYCVKAWTGTDNDQSTDATNTVTMDSDRDVTVEFEECQSRWTDYRFRVRMRSEDDDSIGIMFRCQDENNYYRFSWDKQRAFRRLVKCENGVFSLLAQDSVEYTIGQTYDVEIVADGSNIEVWVDGAWAFSVSDTTFAEGTIALYCWGNGGGCFDDIIVEDLRSGTMLLCEAFDDSNFEGWTIVDQGDHEAPSGWSAETGAMCQSSNIYSLPTGPEIEKLGTFALYEGQICDWDDLACLVSNWLEQNCDASNNWCTCADLNFNSMVDLMDFAILAERWLQNSGW